jgi:hypothetical protein
MDDKKTERTRLYKRKLLLWFEPRQEWIAPIKGKWVK